MMVWLITFLWWSYYYLFSDFYLFSDLDDEDKDDELLEKESRQEPVLPEEPEETITEQSIEPGKH